MSTAHDRMNLQRTKHARSNGPLLPEGYSVARNQWQTTPGWRAYKNANPLRDFTGRRARQDAIAYCFTHAKANTRAVAPAEDGIDDATLGRLRANREEAQR